ncbi:hypothetical protein ASPACDRAFT_34821 [Aspergillus aculeatus ATCC 16872]|uniref:F-box domain-containing protein n=1 Tax=Aspergillus aculeatus (strain ATCC 16872 / CBS 172.66 / WB 5094) TaxID=690307 RepID=A0A1L9WJK6_ASPA1|nr:uncharacterized protein ASPACDRAFT_34821 [Aspergillus aculeatus ATCC 16872]OJJ96346.1 hypothetical protein ASPACDRAFT_34821 [Aspergillus aculeatus ATCC 16872]
MNYDCFCAVCGIGFCGMHFGHPVGSASAYRYRSEENSCRILYANKNLSQLRDGNIYGGHGNNYSPRIVRRENISWIQKVHCLGLKNQDTSGSGEAFLSEQGYYADSGEIEAPGPAFPIHKCCFEILTRTLTGSTNMKGVRLDLLYRVMSSQCNAEASALRLKYGEDVLHAQERYWQCIPGAEYCIIRPTNTIKLNYLAEIQAGKDRKYPPIPTDVCPPENPFSKLPLEIIYMICALVPFDSLKCLMRVSKKVYLATQNNYFWKKFMECTMPWFWELKEERRDALSLSFDYKELYLWLDKVTSEVYGMDELNLMSLANRRRIWEVSEEIADMYSKALGTTLAAP